MMNYRRFSASDRFRPRKGDHELGTGQNVYSGWLGSCRAYVGQQGLNFNGSRSCPIAVNQWFSRGVLEPVFAVSRDSPAPLGHRHRVLLALYLNVIEYHRLR